MSRSPRSCRAWNSGSRYGAGAGGTITTRTGKGMARLPHRPQLADSRTRSRILVRSQEHNALLGIERAQDQHFRGEGTDPARGEVHHRDDKRAVELAPRVM